MVASGDDDDVSGWTTVTFREASDQADEKTAKTTVAETAAPTRTKRKGKRKGPRRATRFATARAAYQRHARHPSNDAAPKRGGAEPSLGAWVFEGGAVGHPKPLRCPTANRRRR